MHRLVYLSHATSHLPTHGIADIVKRSQINNAKVGLTGMLVYHGNRFFQVLEGLPANLAQRYKCIQADKRHEKMSLLYSSAISKRAFPSWQMSYYRPEELPEQVQQAVFSIYDLMPFNSPARGEDDDTRKLVRDFLASFDRLVA